MTRARLSSLVALVIAGCQPEAAVDVGQRLFSDPRLSRSTFNTVSCATCHDNGTAEADARILAGASLVDSVSRPSWWGGDVVSLKDAVDTCLVFFMREQPLAPSAPASRALYEYLLSISSGASSPPAPLTIVENVADLSPGDPTQGARVYEAACASCHGAAFTGEGRDSPLASVVPTDSVAFAEQNGFSLSLVIVEKVRHGAFFGIGGTMPPFSTEALSDDDLSALLGYLAPASAPR
jgi:thiosulfate dehydrogenase